MRAFRRRLSSLLSIWLFCQLVALASPAVLAAAGAAPVEELCTCPGGDHETCPMHHGSAADQPQTRVCSMTSCCAPLDVALLSLAGGTGVLPAAVCLGSPTSDSPVVQLPHATLEGPVSHDTPPPRA